MTDMAMCLQHFFHLNVLTFQNKKSKASILNNFWQIIFVLIRDTRCFCCYYTLIYSDHLVFVVFYHKFSTALLSSFFQVYVKFGNFPGILTRVLYLIYSYDSNTDFRIRHFFLLRTIWLSNEPMSISFSTTQGLPRNYMNFTTHVRALNLKDLLFRSMNSKNIMDRAYE